MPRRRDAKILRLRAAGRSLTEIAPAVGLTRAGVSAALRRLDAPTVTPRRGRPVTRDVIELRPITVDARAGGVLVATAQAWHSTPGRVAMVVLRHALGLDTSPLALVDGPAEQSRIGVLVGRADAELRAALDARALRPGEPYSRIASRLVQGTIDARGAAISGETSHAP